MDILSHLADPSDEQRTFVLRQRAKVIFPTDIYPPTWDCKKKLESAICNAAMAEGFNLNLRGTNGKTSFRLSCCQGFSYRGGKTPTEIQKSVYTPMVTGEESTRKEGMKHDRFVGRATSNRINKDQKNKTKKGFRGTSRCFTTKPAPSQQCRFHVQLSLEEGKNWFIKPGFGCIIHNHLPQTKDDLRRRVATLLEGDTNTFSTIAAYSKAGPAANILYDISGHVFSNSQINTLRLMHKNPKSLVLPAVIRDNDNLSQNVSDAQQLIYHLEQDHRDHKKFFVAYYHTVSDTSLLTVRKTDLIRDQKRRTEEEKAGNLNDNDNDLLSQQQSIQIQVEATRACSVVTSTCTSLNRKEKEELAAALHPIHDRLKVGQKILLAVAWVRVDELLYFELYPEIFMVDVTYGTNNEGRPLFMSGSVDCDMKTFTPVRAFMPSECKWVFRWLWAEAIPALLGKDNLSRVQMVLSDGDSKIYDTFDQVREYLFPNAVHGLCLYHLVVQKLEDLKLENSSYEEVRAMVTT